MYGFVPERIGYADYDARRFNPPVDGKQPERHGGFCQVG